MIYRHLPVQEFSNSTNTKVWGMVGGLYEVSKDIGNESYSQGRFSTTLSIEKSFGAITIGGEAWK